MSSDAMVQEDFLRRLREEQTPAAVIMANGYKLKGRIAAHDRFTLLVESGDRFHLVYKSAVSTIEARG